MVSIIYFITLLISIADIIYVAQKRGGQVDRYYWTIMILVPVVILGYWLKTKVHTVEAATIAFCFIYLDSTIFLDVCLFSILHSIKVKVSPWIKIGVYGLTVFHLMTIWLSKDNDLYYKSMTLTDTGVGIATRMVGGPLKITHYVFLALIFIAIITSLLVGLIRKGTYSKRFLQAYSVFGAAGILIYLIEMVLDVNFSSLPIFYTIGSINMAFLYEKVQSHNIRSLIGKKQSQTGKRGFVAFDKKKRLLGYNNQFAEVFPDIEKVVIDTLLGDKNKYLADEIYPLIDRCIEQGNFTETILYNNRIYSVTTSSFSVNEDNQKDGYLLELSDITEEQQRIKLIEQYNERLGQDVKEKTAHILDIQNLVVLGLANLVENRDNNTGGHVKRTSDIIKMLVEEASKQGIYKIDEGYAADIVRAAPMHDLGKMYIETSILCKPGRLTDEEFAIMKTHSPKSGEMVKIILDGVEEPHFVNTAFNIARFHHERWDGRGYPEGLMGENIPLEARIMAVADVYDALVSKRCYKEPMSFDTARKIMDENMGTQFDPAMRPIFSACVTKLEEYYNKANN